MNIRNEGDRPPGAMALDEFIRSPEAVWQAFERLPISEAHIQALSDLLVGVPRLEIVRACITAGFLLHEAILVEELAADVLERHAPMIQGPVHRAPRRRRTRGR